MNRDGVEVSELGSEPLVVQYPRLAPEGRRLALTIEGDLWVYDLEGRPPIRLTFDAGTANSGTWTPDGERLAFEQGGGGGMGLIAADGTSTGDIEQLSEGHHHPLGFSPDGGELLFSAQNGDSGWDLFALPMEGGGARTVVASEYEDGRLGAAISPSGQWLAYISDETGSGEVWVRPYPEGGAAVRVSPNGGREPVWSRNGREIFYLEGDKLMAVAVADEQRLRVAPPPSSSSNEPTLVAGANNHLLMMWQLTDDSSRSDASNQAAPRFSSCRIGLKS